MKAVWNAVVIIALANLLGVIGFVGWLAATDRLDLDRVRRLRVTLSMTISEEKAQAAAAAEKIDSDAKAADAAAKAGRPPLTAQEKLSARVEATDLDRERAARLRREVENLQQRLAADAAKLAEERSTLDAEKKAFADSVTAANKQAADEQFQKSLGILVSLKPAAAKSMLSQMISPVSGDNPATATPEAQGESRPPARLTEAVEYLNAMEERPRSRIMTEFVKDDPRLAAELLEKLRIRGQVGKTAAANPEAAPR